jgi:hypothetical protein
MLRMLNLLSRVRFFELGIKARFIRIMSLSLSIEPDEMD